MTMNMREGTNSSALAGPLLETRRAAGEREVGGGGRRLFHYAIMTPPCLLTQYALAALVNAEQFVPWRFFRVHCKQLWYGTNKSKQRMMKVNKNLKRTFHELTKCSS